MRAPCKTNDCRFCANRAEFVHVAVCPLSQRNSDAVKTPHAIASAGGIPVLLTRICRNARWAVGIYVHGHKCGGNIESSRAGEAYVTTVETSDINLSVVGIPDSERIRRLASSSDVRGDRAGGGIKPL